MAEKNFFRFVLNMALTFVSGVAVATFVPVLSIYLTNQLQTTPFQTGLYFTTSAFISVIVSQILAKFSDGKVSRRFLVVMGGIAGCLAAIVLIFGNIWSSYLLVVTLGILFFSLSSVVSPQVFASGREYAIIKYGDSVMFTTYMRAFFALAWVITPPIAYFVAIHLGFTALFSGTSVLYLLIFVLGFLYLPKKLMQNNDNANSAENSSSEEQVSANSNSNSIIQSEKQEKILKNKDVLLLFILSTLLWTCNHIYLISMPIYITKEIHISDDFPGYMMGLAALLEIPIMIIAGKLVKFVGIKNLMLLSTLGGILFYILLEFLPSTSHYLFLCIQFFNALFISILAGLGMIYFQELLPTIPGQATTLSSNSINTGAILSGLLVGVISSMTTYGNMFYINIGFTVISFIMLLFVRKV